MRTYGRITDELGAKTWVVVTTNAQGYNDEVMAVTLAQCLKLNLGEDPFFAQYGIPAHQSVIQQVAPDYNVALTQQQFAPYFTSLIVNKLGVSPDGRTLSYDVKAVTNQGYIINFAQLPQ